MQAQGIDERFQAGIDTFVAWGAPLAESAVAAVRTGIHDVREGLATSAGKVKLLQAFCVGAQVPVMRAMIEQGVQGLDADMQGVATVASLSAFNALAVLSVVFFAKDRMQGGTPTRAATGAVAGVWFGTAVTALFS